MATKTKPKPKAALRGTKPKAGRRGPVRVRASRDILLLPIAVAGVLVAVAIGLVVYGIINTRNHTGPVVASGIPCDALQHSQVHYHAAVQIIYNGNLTPIPANIGISGDPAAPSCYYWLHVHPANQDVIHIESPSGRTFVLSDFFSVWNAWSTAKGDLAQPLDAKHVSVFTLAKDQKLTVYVDQNDGKGAQLYTGDPRTILLKAHEVITLEIGPASADPTPPPAFDWSSASNKGL
jgi:hypothetical protein